MAELRHILLAEDNANDVELTLAALKTNRVLNEVVVTRDGADTLDYLWRRNKYANRSGGNPVLMLLDLKMPKVDGLEVLRQGKSEAQFKLVPTGVLTSSREEQDVVRSYDIAVKADV